MLKLLILGHGARESSHHLLRAAGTAAAPLVQGELQQKESPGPGAGQICQNGKDGSSATCFFSKKEVMVFLVIQIELVLKCFAQNR